MLLENGHLYDRSTAVIHILKSLPRLSFLGDLILLIPCAIRDLFYRIVARMRYRFFGEVSVCGLPPEDIKSKLLK
ncbi:MAG: DCC1-like thiol-disulfide oxidoreductase family protein, partial [Verrucomicrobiota bacterium]|nr:DCC1-like thiol-disulfide oxidoreductase family protein [Verrucomicrobiota bacterium]